MPFPVDNIRAACQKQGTTLAEVERALGIGNGVIAKWEKKKGSPPYDRIIAIAEHLRVPVSDITGEGIKKELTPNWDELRKLTPDQYKNAYREMTDSELYIMMADIANELKSRAEGGEGHK